MSLCPVCSADSQVAESRLLVNNWMRRRRRCRADASHRWTTYELPASELDLESYDKDELRETRYAQE